MQLQKILQNKGLTVLPDNDQWTNRFEIESETSSRIYVVAQRKNLTEWDAHVQHGEQGANANI